MGRYYNPERYVADDSNFSLPGYDQQTGQAQSQAELNRLRSNEAYNEQYGVGQDQRALLAELLRRSKGQGTTAAQQQMQQGIVSGDRAIQSQAANMQGSGASQGFSQYMAGQQKAQNQLVGNQQLGMLKVQEQQQAQEQYGQLLNYLRQQQMQQQMMAESQGMAGFGLGANAAKGQLGGQLSGESIKQQDVGQYNVNANALKKGKLGVNERYGSAFDKRSNFEDYEREDRRSNYSDVRVKKNISEVDPKEPKPTELFAIAAMLNKRLNVLEGK